MDIIKDQLNEANQLLNKVINDELLINSISKASQIMINSIQNKKKNNFMWKWWFYVRRNSFCRGVNRKV